MLTHLCQLKKFFDFWLDTIVTLANVKEDVMEFIIVLSWCTSLLEFVTNDANMGDQKSGQIILQATNLRDPNINFHLN
jgi:hypothetical protein